MDAKITLTKTDNGLYVDSFTITIADSEGKEIRVGINEYDYKAVIVRFALSVEELSFPSQVREICK